MGKWEAIPEPDPGPSDGEWALAAYAARLMGNDRSNPRVKRALDLAEQYPDHPEAAVMGEAIETAVWRPE